MLIMVLIVMIMSEKGDRNVIIITTVIITIVEIMLMEIKKFSNGDNANKHDQRQGNANSDE